LAGSFAVATGHQAPGEPGGRLDYAAMARWPGTLAFYMGVANLPAICRALIEGGTAGSTPAAVIERGATPRQRVVAGTLATLPDAAAAADVQPPAMIVVGRVVALRERLRWFERRPLHGRRVVVTRPRSQAGAMIERLERLGAEAIDAPAIRIAPPADRSPLRQAAAAVGDAQWVVFTSANGVSAFFAALAEAGRDSRALHAAQVCAIGPATAGELAHYGIRPDVQPARFLTAEIADAMAVRGNLRGARVLCPRADGAPANLTDDLAARGAVVQQVAAYRTVADGSAAEAVAPLLTERAVDWITFTSASTVAHFVAAVSAGAVRGSGARLASIGPVTSAALVAAGLAAGAEAEVHTADGVIDAILKAEEGGESR
jgi:uroporphyrinogen III methyltransferase/synthase